MVKTIKSKNRQNRKDKGLVSNHPRPKKINVNRPMILAVNS